MDRRVDVRHFVHRRSCDISSSNMAAYERWPRVSARGTKYSSEVCRMDARVSDQRTTVPNSCIASLFRVLECLIQFYFYLYILFIAHI